MEAEACVECDGAICADEDDLGIVVREDLRWGRRWYITLATCPRALRCNGGVKEEVINRGVEAKVLK